MFRFRIEHFMPQVDDIDWQNLPPIAAHIRAIHVRLGPLHQLPLTSKTLDLCQRTLSSLVDAEAAVQESAEYSPHGWVTLGDPMEDEEINPPLPEAAGLAALTMATFFDRVEKEATDATRARAEAAPSKRTQLKEEFGDELKRLAHEQGAPQARVVAQLAAAMAWVRLKDAEDLLLGGAPPTTTPPLVGQDASVEVAWLAVGEATELVNRAERLRLIDGAGFAALARPKGVLQGTYDYNGKRLKIRAGTYPEEEIRVSRNPKGFTYFGKILNASPRPVDLLAEELLACADEGTEPGEAFDADRSFGEDFEDAERDLGDAFGAEMTLEERFKNDERDLSMAFGSQMKRPERFENEEQIRKALSIYREEKDPEAKERLGKAIAVLGGNTRGGGLHSLVSGIGNKLRLVIAKVREKSPPLAYLLEVGLDGSDSGKPYYESDRVKWTVL